MSENRWQESGACRHVDPDLFFPERGDNVHQAKAVCARCPVAAECFAYAFDPANDIHHGVWGGTSEKDRRGMRRRSVVSLQLLGEA